MASSRLVSVPFCLLNSRFNGTPQDDDDDDVEKEPLAEDDCSDGSQYTLHDREDELAEEDEGDRSGDEDGEYDELPEPDD